MPVRLFAALSALTIAGLCSAAGLPTEFETEADRYDPLFAFFGGVAGINVATSDHLVHSGRSQSIEVLWQPDAFFSRAGAVVGDRLISGPDLNVPAGAMYFSVAVEAPAEGVFSMQVVLAEDDDGDGLIDTLGADDEWASTRFFLAAGASVYNLPLSAFVLSNEGGDGVQGFATTAAMSVELTIETSATYPGGVVESPATYFIDHAGLFATPQTLERSADLNGDGVVGSSDLAVLLAGWGGAGAADLNGDGVVGSSDLAVLLAAWG